jgi:hypothetical protein
VDDGGARRVGLDQPGRDDVAPEQLVLRVGDVLVRDRTGQDVPAGGGVDVRVERDRVADPLAGDEVVVVEQGRPEARAETGEDRVDLVLEQGEG